MTNVIELRPPQTKVNPTEDEVLDFLQSLQHSVVQVSRLDPTDVPEIHKLALAGCDAAIELLHVLAQTLKASRDILCLGCNAMLTEYAGSIVLLKSEDPSEDRVAALPVCRECNASPDVAARVRRGVNALFPGSRAIGNDQGHAPGHA